MYLQRRGFIGIGEHPTKSSLDTNCSLAARCMSILAALLNALHQSRRMKAEHVIHQHRHLIADGNACVTLAGQQR